MSHELMCRDESLGHLLAQYEMGMLTEVEASRFEEHLLECTFCLNELRSFAATAAVMLEEKHQLTRELGRQGLSFDMLKRDIIRESQAALPRTRPSQPRPVLDILFGWTRRPLVWAPALGAAALLIIIGVLWPEGGSKFDRVLQFNVLPYASTTLRGGGSAEAEMGFGRVAYESGSFKQAAEHFRKAAELDAMNGDAWLYLGVSQYLLKDVSAVNSLERAEGLAGGDAVKLTHVKWYLAQAYLLANNVQSALPKLDEVITQQGAHAQEAAELKGQVAKQR